MLVSNNVRSSSNTRAIYRIEVIMSPNYANSTKPFVWSLLSYSNGDWHPEGTGCESSDRLAWDAAYLYYKMYKSDKGDLMR